MDQSLSINAKWFMLVSIFQKIMTFSLNQIMVVSTSPEVLGQAAIQLELLLSTLLFLSREGIRLTVLRQSLSCSDDFQAIVNLSAIPPVVVVCFIGILTCSRGYLTPDYDLKVVYMYSLAAFIECLGETCYNIFQNKANIKPRLSAETAALTAKSVATVMTVAYFHLGVNGFGLAQITYAIVYLVVLLGHIVSTEHSIESNRKLTVFDLIPRPLSKGNPNSIGKWFGDNLLGVAVTLTGSSLLKHVLTESDKIALTLTASAYNQGIYAVTNNYGSLIARVVFLPLEDSSRLAFARLSAELKTCALAVVRGAEQKHVPNVGVDHPEESLYKKSINDLLATYVRLLRLVSFIGLFVTIFGIPYVPIGVQYVLGKQWRSPETCNALSMYCLYLLVMGVNGISESFVQSAAPPSAFRTLNTGLILSSLGFIAAAGPAVSLLGTSGIILANVISMTVRIANNVSYTRKMFAKPNLFVDIAVTDKMLTDDSNTLKRAEVALMCGAIPSNALNRLFVPPNKWVIATIMSVLITQISAYWYARLPPPTQTIKLAAVHVAVGAVVAVLFLGVSVICAPVEETALIVRYIPFLRGKSVAMRAKEE